MFDPPWPRSYNIGLPSMSSPVRVSAGSSQAGWLGHFINVRHCGGLSMFHLQLKDPLELFVKRREYIPGSGILYHRDMN